MRGGAPTTGAGRAPVCGLCVGGLVVSAAWPHDAKDVCRLKWATLWRVPTRVLCEVCGVPHVCVSAATANSALGGGRGGGCRPGCGWGVGGTAPGVRGRAAERKRDGRAPGIQSRHKTRQISRVSRYTEGKEPIFGRIFGESSGQVLCRRLEAALRIPHTRGRSGRTPGSHVYST